MKVSVIIPVYNVKASLAQAINSALDQPEVAELLLIDDGSTDMSLQMAVMYAQNHPVRIRVFQHPDQKNHGAAATRNLGLTQARSPFIAFLDADDIYLRGRFIATEQLFISNEAADGIYETVETRSTRHDIPETDLKSAGPQYAKIVPGNPENLFSNLVCSQGGYIHLNGLVIRRSALDDSLFFDPQMLQCQDTDFVMRWAMSRKLYGGNPDRVVALRRIHDQNRVFNTKEALHYRYLCMRKCALNAFYGSVDMKANWQVLNRMARATPAVQWLKRWHLPVSPVRLIVIARFLISHPHVVKHLI
jgi:glycosyltransferase involved in cell wall biosynthesis